MWHWIPGCACGIGYPDAVTPDATRGDGYYSSLEEEKAAAKHGLSRQSLMAGPQLLTWGRVHVATQIIGTAVIGKHAVRLA